jgi:hypothetical protein
MANQREHVFICYSRKDDKWRERVQTTLAPFLRTGEVKTWDDRNILPGSDWRPTIDRALSDAAVGLVLASADSLASDFITTVELPALLAAAERGELMLLWVLLHDCLWSATPLARYQSPLGTDRPLAALSPTRQDAAIVNLCFAIRDALERQRSRASLAQTRPAQGPRNGSGGTQESGAPSDFSAERIIAEMNQRVLRNLAEDLAAAVRQLGELDNAVQRGRLERQIEGIKAEIQRLAG